MVEKARTTAPAEIKEIKLPAAMLNPEVQAAVNAMVSATVKDIFAQMSPVFSSIALTPEKIAEAERIRRAPDPAAVARERRERKLMAIETEENRQNLARVQQSCPHKYVSGQWSVNPIRNYPDRQERFICMLCHKLFQPRHWEIAPPDAENPRGRAFIAPMDDQYLQVRECLAGKG